MKRIVFIEPNPPDLHVFARMPLPRLGTLFLGTTLKEHGYDVVSYVEAIAPLDLDDILKADAVGISAITSTSCRSYEIAKLVKKAGIPVFMGGPHVTYMPEEALEHCDFVVRGEADDIIVDFIKALEAGEGFENIPGLTYRKDGEIVHNQSAVFCKDLDKVPCPDFSLLHGFGTDKGLKRFTIAPIMTSRGCPYDCSFCSVTGMFGQKYRFRSKERVLEELEAVKDLGGNWVFFYDDNFIAHKKRTKELLRAMIDRGLTPNWTAQVRVEVARDQELMELMKKSGCHTVYIGFESINPATLEAYNKKQSVEDIEDCIRILHGNGIKIHGMFVFGSDMDTVDTIRATARFAKKNDIETVQFLILTPLPGTQCYRELESEGRIISKDWSLYDAHHVVFEPKLMSYYDLQSNTIAAIKDFYSLGQIIKRAVRMDLLTVSLKAYGRSLIRKWSVKNQYFLDYTQALTTAGKSIELAAKKTAEDIKEKYREIELSRGTIHPKPH